MNIEKHLILIKGEDRTEAISHCMYEKGKWQVKFANDKSYSYNYLNVQWRRDPVSLPGATTVVYQNNQPLSGVNKIFVFGDYIPFHANNPKQLERDRMKDTMNLPRLNRHLKRTIPDSFVG